jgi:hypothetical protein
MHSPLPAAHDVDCSRGAHLVGARAVVLIRDFPKNGPVVVAEVTDEILDCRLRR